MPEQTPSDAQRLAHHDHEDIIQYGLDPISHTPYSLRRCPQIKGYWTLSLYVVGTEYLLHFTHGTTLPLQGFLQGFLEDRWPAPHQHAADAGPHPA